MDPMALTTMSEKEPPLKPSIRICSQRELRLQSKALSSLQLRSLSECCGGGGGGGGIDIFNCGW